MVIPSFEDLEDVAHVNQFISEELTFLGGQFQTMLNQGSEHVQNSVHVILFFAVDQQVIHDGYAVLGIREFFHYKTNVLDPFAWGNGKSHRHNFIPIEVTSKIG